VPSLSAVLREMIERTLFSICNDRKDRVPSRAAPRRPGIHIAHLPCLPAVIVVTTTVSTWPRPPASRGIQEAVAKRACSAPKYVGSPGGWPIAPVADDRSQPLPYPVGVADVEGLTGRRLDRDGLRRVRFLFQLGDADTNDSVPALDSFSPAGEALVMQRFGKTPVARWPAAQRLYAAARLHARFALYPGAGHSWTPEMRADTEAVFQAALRDPR
jgi:hypothetical protein